jgi:twitching motility protein PilT
LHTTDASKTIERIIGVFALGEQNAMRNRLAKSFRYIISQRLMPRKDGAGRIAIIEILKSTLRTREYVEKGEVEGKSLLDAMRDGSEDGMQCFDDEIEKNIRSGTIDMETGLSYSTNPGNLRLQLADLLEEGSGIPSARAALREPAKPAKSANPLADPELEIIR